VHGRPEVIKQDGVTVVVFGRELKNITEDRIPAVSEAMLEAGDADPPRVALDLTRVEFFSSSFIEVVFRLWNRLNRSPDGRLALCGLTQYCREVLEVTNLDELWTIYPDLESGVAALSPSE
jgi:anti-sigma B factor antagonist